MSSLLSKAQMSNTIWSNFYSDSVSTSRDEIIDAVISSNGNLYVTGYTENNFTNFDITTLAFDKNHNIIWKNTFTSDAHFSYDQPLNIFVDNKENTYIAGQKLIGMYSGYTPIFLKYDKFGNRTWIDTSSFSQSLTYVCGIIADNYENTYCYFYANSKTYLQKKDKNGTEIWSKTLEGYPIKMLFEENNIYIICKELFSYEVSKIDSAGTVLWNTKYTAAQNKEVERIPSIVMDSNKNLYIAANIYINDYWPTDVVVNCFNNEGEILWTDTYQGEDYDKAIELKLDNDNNIYLGLNTRNSLNINDILILKYNTQGIKIDSIRIKNQFNNNIYLNGLDTDANNFLYLTGITFTDNNKMLTWVSKLDSSMETLWQNNLSISDSTRKYPTKIFVNNDRISIIGNTRRTYPLNLPYDNQSDYLLFQMDTSGNELNHQTYGQKGTTIYENSNLVLDSKGNSYVSSTSRIGPHYWNNNYYFNYYYVLMKYDTNGKLEWSHKITNDTLDGSGYIKHYLTNDSIITLYTGFYPNTIVSKFNSEGKLLTQKNIGDLNPWEVAKLDSEGNLYFIQYANNSLFKLSSNLQELWVYKIDKTLGSPKMWITNDNGVLIIDGNILKINNQGVKEWEIQNINMYTINDCIFDSTGSFYLTGSILNNGTDLIICKYDSYGNLLWRTILDDCEGGTKLMLKSNNNLIVYGRGGITGLYEFSKTGDLLKSAPVNASSETAYIDRNDNIHIFNHVWFGANYSNYFLKYSPKLDLIYKQTIEEGLFPKAFSFGGIAVDKNNNIIVTGSLGDLPVLNYNEWSVLATFKLKQENQKPELILIPNFAKGFQGDTISYKVNATDFDGDSVFYSITEDFEWIKIDPINGTLKAITNGISNGIYKIGVCATDKHGAFDIDTLTIKIGYEKPVFITTPTLETRSNQTYNYQAIAEDNYGSKIFYKMTTGPIWLSCDSLGLLNGIPRNNDIGEHQIELKAYNVYADTASQVFKISVITNTNVETTLNDSIKIFPIPTSDRLFISLENLSNEIVSVDICNLNGQILDKKQFNYSLVSNQIELSVKDILNGYYLLVIRTKNEVFTKKIIIYK